jgi:hypothetical protein
MDGWLMQRAGGYVMEHALPAARAALCGIVPSELDPGQTGLLGAASLAWETIPLE